ncbi:radical SAM/SPASM domain-containing protein [Haloimpatiens massiliensis]|uniref:radical SAM/SPASM domain-containing protein n=1 Tax=Haloimpatiens massiliensis TaxID=1658110 RepID=UPI0015E08045|nr:radical SAM protein [Haloimpatiens massiliensis]
MKIFDTIEAFLKISISIDDLTNDGNFYLLKGDFNYEDEIINIIDFINLDEYMESCENDKLPISKKKLYASIKEFKKNKWVYILVHARASEEKSKSEFSYVDSDLCELLKNKANELGYSLPLVFTLVCKESLIFKIYYNDKIIIQDTLYTKFEEYDSSMWNLKVLSSDSYNKAAIYHKNTNSIILINASEANKISEWQIKFKENKLTSLQRMVFKKFVYSNFDIDNKNKMLSDENFKKTGIINHLQFMVQLSCNLKCKYCYADEGTYGFSNNIILDKNHAVVILNNLIKKGIHKIDKITFFGGEPSIYPEVIKAICEHCKYLNSKGDLVSIPKFYMVTNGTNLNELLIETIKEYEIKLTISLDGPLYINDQLRINKNGEGTYTCVYNNLIKMKKNSIKPAMVEATYTNIHEINNISRCDLRNILKKELSIPIVYLADCTSTKFKPKTVENVQEGILKRIDDAMINNNIAELDNEILNLIKRILNHLNNKSITNNLYCSSGYKMISILGNGAYYPCHRFVGNENYKIGNILDDKINLSFKDILKKNEIEYCKDCWASEFCNKCTWKLLNEKNTSFISDEINSCNKTRTIIKHVILTYINLNTGDKKRFINNIKKLNEL